jgi:hypothetical protein
MAEEKIPIPHKIATENILDPQTRWICQRLDNLYKILTEVLTELRDVNGKLADIQQEMYNK